MDSRSDKVIRKSLHIIEQFIAYLTLAVLVGMLALEIYKMVTVADYFSSVHTFLNNILTIVVGLEFVRMLIDLTPSNTIEVLIMAIARQVIVTHEDPISNICCVVCIAILFATRRFLIYRKEIKGRNGENAKS